jgi:hypothetical protein
MIRGEYLQAVYCRQNNELPEGAERDEYAENYIEGGSLTS